MDESITLACFLFLVLVVPSIKSEDMAPAPAPAPAQIKAAPINLTAILEKGSEYSTFIHLLNATQVSVQVSIQLNSSNQGVTVFAPTNNGFTNLKPGTLNGLSNQQQIQLMLYHIIPKYYSMSDLISVSNPVRTLATGQDSGDFRLNFTGQSNQVNISTGVVLAHVNNALRQHFPLAVYMMEQVLLPQDMFGSPPPETKAPSASPTAPAPEKSPSDHADSPDSDEPPAASEEPESGSGGRGTTTGFGLVLGLAWFCFGLLS
ncbi:PREDICTED: fasciclin-like arabinogalactan protein 6 [Tarenaya hassleriana]|uniref:fasciclin-like arabinogalactan protein 6 n=1 Tax=Tarenaya hassleriana TaxID=28532 RepID=UPI00053C1F97|nr:PREDICTED: fasciclin-like arabinogalactan protein 6 [Tarenaya hassleriana]